MVPIDSNGKVAYVPVTTRDIGAEAEALLRWAGHERVRDGGTTVS